jgi:hypothetical protein
MKVDIKIEQIGSYLQELIDNKLSSRILKVKLSSLVLFVDFLYKTNKIHSQTYEAIVLLIQEKTGYQI